MSAVLILGRHPGSLVISLSSLIVNATWRGPRRPMISTCRIRLSASASNAWAQMSVFYDKIVHAHTCTRSSKEVDTAHCRHLKWHVCTNHVRMDYNVCHNIYTTSRIIVPGRLLGLSLHKKRFFPTGLLQVQNEQNGTNKNQEHLKQLKILEGMLVQMYIITWFNLWSCMPVACGEPYILWGYPVEWAASWPRPEQHYPDPAQPLFQH